jgi:hypothetical protein
MSITKKKLTKITKIIKKTNTKGWLPEGGQATPKDFRGGCAPPRPLLEATPKIRWGWLSNCFIFYFIFFLGKKNKYLYF